MMGFTFQWVRLGQAKVRLIRGLMDSYLVNVTLPMVGKVRHNLAYSFLVYSIPANNAWIIRL
jgi:hypothetical protein